MLKESTQLQLLLAPPQRWVPAHIAAHDGICAWCGTLVRVQRLPIPHITIPICESCAAILRGGKPDDGQEPN